LTCWKVDAYALHIWNTHWSSSTYLMLPFGNYSLDNLSDLT